MGAIIRLNEVTKKTGLCSTSIYNLISEHKFPKQLKLTKRASGWLETEVDQWIADRVAERDHFSNEVEGA